MIRPPKVRQTCGWMRVSNILGGCVKCQSGGGGGGGSHVYRGDVSAFFKVGCGVSKGIS